MPETKTSPPIECSVEVERLAVEPDPIAIAACLSEEDRFSALIGTGEHPDAARSVFGIRPYGEVVMAAGGAGPFEALSRLVDSAVVKPRDDVPFAGGVIALLGFDLRVHLERLPDRHPPDRGCPELLARFFPAVVVCDRKAGSVSLCRLAQKGGGEFERASLEAAAAIRKALERPAIRSESSRASTRPRALTPKADYLADVERIIEYIRAGDVYQVNYSQRFEGPASADPIGVLGRLARVNPAPFGGMMRLGPDSWLISASPERFLRIDGKTVIARPIKGTIARGADPASDRAAAETLLRSEKNRAELAMIVDLLRNDLSQSCEPGSVVVADPISIETHPTVHHLVATVKGRIAAQHDRIAVVRNAFPGGSISGVPKIRALEIIDELEDCRRGPYTGSLGWFGADGRVDLNILIRSMRLEGGRAWLHGGGGVVVDSDPEGEWEESVQKLRGLFDALAWEAP